MYARACQCRRVGASAPRRRPHFRVGRDPVVAASGAASLTVRVGMEMNRIEDEAELVAFHCIAILWLRRNYVAY